MTSTPTSPLEIICTIMLCLIIAVCLLLPVYFGRKDQQEKERAEEAERDMTFKKFQDGINAREENK